MKISLILTLIMLVLLGGCSSGWEERKIVKIGTCDKGGRCSVVVYGGQVGISRLPIEGEYGRVWLTENN